MEANFFQKTMFKFMFHFKLSAVEINAEKACDLQSS